MGRSPSSSYETETAHGLDEGECDQSCNGWHRFNTCPALAKKFAHMELMDLICKLFYYGGGGKEAIKNAAALCFQFFQYVLTIFNC